MSYSKEKLLKSQQLARQGIIYAPASFLTATENELVSICNGCGASGSYFRPPATLYGTWIGAACNVHDFMYQYGRTIEDKDEADRTMLNNMLRLINRDSGKWYKPSMLQRARARKYYYAVKLMGGEAFWKGKN